jgi:hypothetical protein
MVREREGRGDYSFRRQRRRPRRNDDVKAHGTSIIENNGQRIHFSKKHHNQVNPNPDTPAAPGP